MRRPRKPKGLQPSPPPRQRGRRIGASPIYSPEQNYNYKSQAVRYAKGAEMPGPAYIETEDGVIYGGDNAEQIRNNADKLFEEPLQRWLFHYASRRSPSGLWTVQVDPSGMQSDLVITGDTETRTDDRCPLPSPPTWSWEPPTFTFTASPQECNNSDSTNTEPLYFPPNYPDDADPPVPLPPPYGPPLPPGQTEELVLITTSFVIRRYTSFFTPLGDPSSIFYRPTRPSVADVFNDDPLEGLVYSIGDTQIYARSRAPFALPNVFYGVRNTGSTLGVFLNPSARWAYFTVQYYVEVIYLGFGTDPSPGDPGTPYPPTPAPAFPNAPYAAPTVGGGGGEDGLSDTVSYALAGGTWESNALTLAEETTITLTAEWAIALDTEIFGQSSVTWRIDDGMPQHIIIPPGTAGSGSDEAEITIPAGSTIQFFIFVDMESKLSSLTVDIPLGEPGGQLEFTCTCPDFSRQQGVLHYSPYNSEQVDREWVNSSAGADQTQGCKHIYNCKIFLGEDFEIPTDYPI